jgi:hypothetical protein
MYIIYQTLFLSVRNITMYFDCHQQIQGWVKNYPQCRYMLCSWVHCWLGMMWYMWSTCLQLFWCRCGLDSQFMSWVLCNKLWRYTFRLHQRRAEGRDPLWVEGVPGAEMHRRISVQYGNSVVSHRMVYEWIEKFKNGRTSIKHEEGARCFWLLPHA